jgi:hypothetical protein
MIDAGGRCGRWCGWDGGFKLAGKGIQEGSALSRKIATQLRVYIMMALYPPVTPLLVRKEMQSKSLGMEKRCAADEVSE